MLSIQRTHPLTRRFVDLLNEGRKRAAALGCTVLVSLAQQVGWRKSPIETFAAGKAAFQDRRFWGRPGDGFWLLGLGMAAAMPQGVMEGRRGWRDVLAGALATGPAVRGVGPLLLGGFPFDPHVPGAAGWEGLGSSLLLPQILLTWRGEQTWLTVNVLVGPQADPGYEADRVSEAIGRLEAGPGVGLGQPDSRLTEETSRADWEARLAGAMKAFSNGEASKIVLARKKMLQAASAFSVEAALEYLSKAYPSCAIFALGRGDACFLGASPESLVKLTDDEVSLTCMGGTTGRGVTLREDNELARRLLASGKDQREHAAVVQQIAECLRGLCKSLTWDTKPRVARLKSVQHLATAFRGRAYDGKDILEMVAALHPTPAVGGVPKAIALDIIRQLEGDRGWYAGPVGWLDARGEGEFWVGIRSALIEGDKAILYAGAGIVEGSVAEEEFQETELKFQPLLRALSSGPLPSGRDAH